MRILHLIDSFGLYGAEKVVLDLVQQQQQRGWHSVLGSIGGKADAWRPYELAAVEEGLTVKKFPMRRGFNIVGGMRIARYAREQGFQLFHSHGYKGNIIVGLLPRFLRGLPFLTTLHGWRPPHRLSLWVVQYVEQFSIRRADRVAVVHPELTNHARLARLTNRICVIRNGIPVPPPLPKTVLDKRLDERIRKLSSHALAIVALARLSHEKGLDLLLHAAAKLRWQGIDCSVTIFGEGEERGRLQRLIQALELAPFAHLAGYVADGWSQLPRFNCLAIPSLAEACPLVALEGMRAGIPIVASTAGGLPGLLGRGQFGQLFPIANTDALCLALTNVANYTEEVRQMTCASRAVVQENYTSARMAAAYERLYREMVG